MAMQQRVRFVMSVPIILPVIFIVGLSCATTKKADLIAKSSPQVRRLVLGETVANRNPLPNYQAVWLEEETSGDPGAKRLIYRLWDFDKNGLADYIQQVDSKGRVSGSYFDFDADGKIDLKLP